MSARLLTPPAHATIDDLMCVEGKAELIGGRIVRFMATGHQPNMVAGRIYRSLADHCDKKGAGLVYSDNMGFAVPMLSSGRQSFSPDVSYYDGSPPANRMRFVDDAPTFAVEVRSENDYGPAADRIIATKRDDYFEAGTLVVWDVDPVARTIDTYRADSPTQPIRFMPGQLADAEPAVSGWQVDAAWILS